MMVQATALILAVVLSLVSIDSYSTDDLQARARSVFSKIPNRMPGADADSVEKIALGEALYFDTALSVNDSRSCNSCHNLLDGGAGVDHLVTSIGALGTPGRRNAPSTWNAGFQFAQNWDASAKNLAEQARGPILSPSEMAMPSEEAAVSGLRRAGYADAFERAFPDHDNALNFDNITEALAAFQRTLITRDRFDLFLAGDTEALNIEERRGLQLMLQKGCISCHSGPLMGGQFLTKMGLINPYPNTEDKGHGEISGREQQNYMFKVPMLRNIALTAPFFHDGQGKDLESAVLATGWHQVGVRFTPDEVANISAFLRALNNTRPFVRSARPE